MGRLLRLLRIASVGLRYGLDQIAFANLEHPLLVRLARIAALGRRFDSPRAVRLRQALESLGPIFVKFGQMLSTRRDLLPGDFADELARLQDRVPPFDPQSAAQEIERGLGRPIASIFAEFDREPVASASIAQVHFAVMGPGPLMPTAMLPGCMSAWKKPSRNTCVKKISTPSRESFLRSTPALRRSSMRLTGMPSMRSMTRTFSRQ